MVFKKLHILKNNPLISEINLIKIYTYADDSSLDINSFTTFYDFCHYSCAIYFLIEQKDFSSDGYISIFI